MCVALLCVVCVFFIVCACVCVLCCACVCVCSVQRPPLKPVMPGLQRLQWTPADQGAALRLATAAASRVGSFTARETCVLLFCLSRWELPKRRTLALALLDRVAPDLHLLPPTVCTRVRACACVRVRVRVSHACVPPPPTPRRSCACCSRGWWRWAREATHRCCAISSSAPAPSWTRYPHHTRERPLPLPPSGSHPPPPLAAPEVRLDPPLPLAPPGNESAPADKHFHGHLFCKHSSCGGWGGCTPLQSLTPLP